MPNLRDLIEAVLEDVEDAQHAANVHAAELARRYRDNAILAYFPAPNAVVRELEVDLRFGSGELTSAPRSARFEWSRSAMRRYALPMTAAVLAAISADAKDAELAERLRSEPFLSDVVARVAERLASALEAEPSKGMRPADAARAAAETLSAVLLSSPELAAALGPAGLEAALESTRREWQSSMDGLARAVSTRDTHYEAPELPVNPSLSALGEVPPQAVHAVKIKVELRGYKWVVVDPATGDAQLVPQD